MTTRSQSRHLTADEAERYVRGDLSIPELFGLNAERVRVDVKAGRDENGHYPLILDFSHEV